MATRSSDAAAHAVAANNLAALVGPRGEGGASRASSRRRARADKTDHPQKRFAAPSPPPPRRSRRWPQTAPSRFCIPIISATNCATPAAPSGSARRRNGRRGIGGGGNSPRARTKTRSRRGDLHGQLVRQSTPGTDAHRLTRAWRARRSPPAREITPPPSPRTSIVDERFAEIAGAPATLVALHELAGDVDAADAVLDDIAAVAKRARRGGDSRGGPRVIPLGARRRRRRRTRRRARWCRPEGGSGIARRCARGCRRRARRRLRHRRRRTRRTLFSRRSCRRAGVRFRTRTRSRRPFLRASSSAPPIWNERLDAERVNARRGRDVMRRRTSKKGDSSQGI